MNWDEILDNLPIMTRPTKITALQFVTEGYNDRGDNQVFLDGRISVYSGIDVGYNTVDIFTSDGSMQVPADTEFTVIWDSLE